MPRFSWVNAIDYAVSQGGRHHLSLHVVVCEETWAVVDTQGNTQTKTARHAWLSSHPLCRGNLHERCNLGARYRWGIEANFLVEKHQGYLAFIRSSCAAPWLDPERMRLLFAQPFQLQLE